MDFDYLPTGLDTGVRIGAEFLDLLRTNLVDDQVVIMSKRDFDNFIQKVIQELDPSEIPQVLRLEL
jgi:hypothetical protein